MELLGYQWLVTATIEAVTEKQTYRTAVVGVFNRPRYAYALQGFLASWQEMRTINVTRVALTGRGHMEAMYENPSMDAAYWTTQEGTWESVNTHEIEVQRWHEQERKTFPQGFHWQRLAPTGGDRFRMEALGIVGLMPDSSASLVIAGPVHEQPSERCG